MKTYFNTFCKQIGLAALAYSMAFLCGCYPGWIVPQRVEVFEQRPFYQYKQKGRLMITPFDTLEDARQPAGLGARAARIFEEQLTKKHFFRSIAVIPEEEWLDQLEQRENKIRKFIGEAQQAQADLILYGGIENYVYGATTDTSITVSVHLVNSATAETVWWGKSTVTGKPGAAFLLLNSSTSPASPELDRCLKRAAGRIIAQMFSSIDSIEKPGFFRSIMQKLARPASAPSHKSDVPLPESPDNSSREPAQTQPESVGTPPSQGEHKLPPEQVLDQAIERLESLERQ